MSSSHVSRKVARILRPVVLDRSGCCCEACGWYCPLVIEVHHVKSVSSGEIGLMDNLVALCPNCHRIVEKLKAIAQKDFFLENPHIDKWLLENYNQDAVDKIYQLVWEKMPEVNQSNG